MNRKGLDEMQVQRKNKIGNQAFVMLMYLLLLDAGLYGFGFRWLNYPANIVVIITVCAGIYLFRLIKGNAYVGPGPEVDKPVRTAVFTVLFAVLAAMLMILFLKHAGFSNSDQINDMTAPILFMASASALFVVVMISVIKKRQNRNDEEE